MRVLVACEESQAVCTAFRALGHEAYSCDIQEPSGVHPEWHILGDALKAIEGGQVTTMDGQVHDVGRWDLLIAHPPCTYLSNAGANRLRINGEINQERMGKAKPARCSFDSSTPRARASAWRIRFPERSTSCRHTRRSYNRTCLALRGSKQRACGLSIFRSCLQRIW